MARELAAFLKLSVAFSVDQIREQDVRDVHYLWSLLVQSKHLRGTEIPDRTLTIQLSDQGAAELPRAIDQKVPQVVKIVQTAEEPVMMFGVPIPG